MQQKVALQAEALEISMKLEETPVGESSPSMSQILNQLTSLSLQVEDMKKDRGKEKREDIWCIICEMLHIIFVIPMIVNDVNLSVAFRGVSGLSS
jgi:hypothetical protein